MTIKFLILILSSISLSAFAQISLKFGMSNENIQNTLLVSESLLEKLIAVTFNAYVVSGVVMYVLSMVLWLFVLAKIDVSVAYPFVGIGFIITMMLGYFLLNEQLTMIRIAGTILVICGVLMISTTQT